MNLSADQIPYAHWTNQAYTVAFNANGGNVQTSSTTVSNGGVYGTLPTPTRSGYTFMGWYTSPGGGEQITAETTVGLSDSQVLYVHWEKVPSQPAASFADVKPDDWFAEPAQWAVGRKITAGTGDGTTFSPE